MGPERRERQLDPLRVHRVSNLPVGTCGGAPAELLWQESTIGRISIDDYSCVVKWSVILSKKETHVVK